MFVYIHELTLFPVIRCFRGRLTWIKEAERNKGKKNYRLKESLTTGKKVETETKYFVLLPTKEAHESYHPTSGLAGFAQ